jgi:outer membrane protein assembly factor BamB
MKIDDLLYVCFNGKVVALDKSTGEIVWDWVSPRRYAFVAALLDQERLFVSASGYTWCLDALTGKERWFNELKGYGMGVAMLVSSAGHGNQAHLGAVAAGGS